MSLHELPNAFPVYYPTPQGWGEHQHSGRELVWQDGKVTDRIIEDLGY